MHNQFSNQDGNLCYYFYCSLSDNCAHSVTKYFFLYAVPRPLGRCAQGQLPPLPLARHATAYTIHTYTLHCFHIILVVVALKLADQVTY